MNSGKEPKSEAILFLWGQWIQREHHCNVCAKNSREVWDPWVSLSITMEEKTIKWRARVKNSSSYTWFCTFQANVQKWKTVVNSMSVWHGNKNCSHIFGGSSDVPFEMQHIVSWLDYKCVWPCCRYLLFYQLLEWKSVLFWFKTILHPLCMSCKSLKNLG